MRDKKVWQESGLKKELAFHQHNKWRQSKKFLEDSKNFFNQLGIEDFSLYKNKNILDAGCGSRLRTAVFSESNLFGIDPLLSEFSKIEWSDLNILKEGYSEPLETFIPELKDKMDYIFCINVLDHCYNWKEVLPNLKEYLKEDGTLYLSFDYIREVNDDIHVQINYQDFMYELLNNFVPTKIEELPKSFDSRCKAKSFILKKAEIRIS